MSSVPQEWSGAQVQQEIRVGSGQEEADAAGEVRPHPAGAPALTVLDGDVSQKTQAFLLCAAGCQGLLQKAGAGEGGDNGIGHSRADPV